MPKPAKPHLTVIGTGYLGAVHAASMASIGFEVLAIDVDVDKIEKLKAGQPPFFEPGFEALLRSALDSGNLRFTTSFEEIGEFGDVHFLCVGTPQHRDSLAADLSWVRGAIASLAPHLDRPCVIAGKSTVPVGTAAWLQEYINGHAPAGAQAEVLWNPEFLREGFAVQDTLHPDRIVLGAHSDEARDQLCSVYAPMIAEGIPVINTTLETAELVKAAANSFLATKISFINAMADVCEAAGGDVVSLAEAIGYDTRIGHRFLGAGIGFGGGCLPKDIRAFSARASELGVGDSLSFLHEVDRLNSRRRDQVPDWSAEMLDGDAYGARIACLGAAFKPDSDDVRDSPALSIAGRLHLAGAQVRVFDPQAGPNSRRSHPELIYATSAADALQDADLVLLLTEWDEFKSLDPVAVAKLVSHQRIIDGRNALDPQKWRAAGWEYRGIGRP